MKAVLWLGFAVMAAAWTGLTTLTLSATEWLATAVADGQAQDILQQAGQMPIPGWLSPWVDASGLHALQAGLLWAIQLIEGALPASATLMSWIAPLVWVLWGFGMLALLLLTGGLHWLIGRTRRIGTLQGLAPR